MILSAGPGDVFVVRNIANLVPPHGHDEATSVAAAVWYATTVLQVTDIMVCGHSNCGGMKALLEMEKAPDVHLGRWLAIAKDARNAWLEGNVFDPTLPSVDQLSQTCTLHQLTNLRTHPSVAARVAEGKLNLHACWFDVADGSVRLYSEREGRYVPALPELERVSIMPLPPRAASSSSP